MPYISGPKTHKAVLEIMADGHFMRRGSRIMQTSGIDYDSDGHKFLYPGMILAQDSTSSYYLPYTQGATYGTGTDTAVGILREFHDATFGDPIVDPIVHGKVIEQHIYEIGAALGTVPSGVKTSLTLIQWI